MEVGLFFYAFFNKKCDWNRYICYPNNKCTIYRKKQGHDGLATIGNNNFRFKSEVEVVRTRITLECTECKNRNYNTMKDKKNHPERMETKKYCKFCRSHTTHKETK